MNFKLPIAVLFTSAFALLSACETTKEPQIKEWRHAQYGSSEDAPEQFEKARQRAWKEMNAILANAPQTPMPSMPEPESYNITGSGTHYNQYGGLAGTSTYTGQVTANQRGSDYWRGYQSVMVAQQSEAIANASSLNMVSAMGTFYSVMKSQGWTPVYETPASPKR